MILSILNNCLEIGILRQKCILFLPKFQSNLMSNFSTIEESRCIVSAQKNVDKKTHKSGVPIFFSIKIIHFISVHFFIPKQKRGNMQKQYWSRIYFIFTYLLIKNGFWGSRGELYLSLQHICMYCRIQQPNLIHQTGLGLMGIDGGGVITLHGS